MSSTSFDFTPFLRAGLPPPAARWTGRVKHDFTGGNNDADALPLDGLIAAADAVLRREGRTLSTYGLNSGPQGYRALRDFLVSKQKHKKSVHPEGHCWDTQPAKKTLAGYRTRFGYR